MPDQVAAIIRAARCRAECEHLLCWRNELLLRTLWATGARRIEVVELQPLNVLDDSFVLPTYKNGVELDGARPWRRVYLPAGQRDLPEALRAWARATSVPPEGALFWSSHTKKRGAYKPITPTQVYNIVRAASLRAGVFVLALRPSQFGKRGHPAPVHPHIFRHARVRAIVRGTKSLALAQRQMGWSQLMLAYLTLDDEESRELMALVPE